MNITRIELTLRSEGQNIQSAALLMKFQNMDDTFANKFHRLPPPTSRESNHYLRLLKSLNP